MADHDDLVRRLRELGDAPTSAELDALVHSRMAQGRLEAGPTLGRRWRPTRLVAAAAAVLLVSLGGLGVAGALPAPAQRLVHDVAEHVGIGLPDADEGPAPGERDEPSGAGATTTTGVGSAADADGDRHDHPDETREVDPEADAGGIRGGADEAARPGATADSEAADRTPPAEGATPVQTTAVPSTDQTTVPADEGGAAHGNGSANGDGTGAGNGNGSGTQPTHPPHPSHPTTTTRPAKPKQDDAAAGTTSTSKPRKPKPDETGAPASTTTEVTGPKG